MYLRHLRQLKCAQMFVFGKAERHQNFRVFFSETELQNERNRDIQKQLRKLCNDER